MSDPRVAQLAARYSALADSYDSLWSPIIRPMSAPLFQALELPARPLVLDVGCGTGALADDIRAAVPDAIVAGVDLAQGMVARAVAERRELGVAGSATAIPFGSQTFDLVFSVFVLQHVPDPETAIVEMGRLVRPGGSGATVTWGPMKDSYAEDVLDGMLEQAGAPPLEDARIDTSELLDETGKVAAAWEKAGLRIQRTWTQQIEYHWTVDSLMAVTTGYGRARGRFEQLTPQARKEFVAAARARLSAMNSEELAWRPFVVFAVARR